MLAAAAAGYFTGRLLSARDLAREQEYARRPPLGLGLRLDVGDGFAPWREAVSVAAAGPGDRVFAIDREAGELRFGDGEHGARPPAGSRVHVAYRAGGGADGDPPG